MADFVLLYKGGSMPETNEERAAVMDAWTAWFGDLGNAVKDGGNPFTETGRRIRTNGSVGDLGGAGNPTGYTILQADSLDAATTLAKGCPVLQGGGEIEVYEAFPVM
jgi:hypothetical protein